MWGLLRQGTAKPGAQGDRRLAQELIDRGMAAESAGKAAEALGCFREAIEADPRFALAHMNLGIALQVAGESAAAIAAHTQAIALDPGSAAAHYNLALGYLEAGQALEAESEFREALRLGTQFPEAWVGLADALEALGRDQEALAALETAIGQREHYLGAQFNASVLLRKMGRPEAAEARLRRIDLAALYSSPDRHAELESVARQMLQVWPDYAQGWKALGAVLALQRRFDEAVQALQNAVEGLPSDAEVHNALGAALQALGRPAEAEAHCRRAVQLDPDSHFANFNLGIALQALGRLPEAEAIFRRAIELKPDAYQAHTNLGNVLQAVRRFSESEATYRLALELAPDSDATHSNLGSALRELGRLDEAESCFRRAIDLNPHGNEAHSNLLFTLNSTANLSRTELFNEHLDWARRHETPRVAQRRIHRNIRDKNKKLRIGYVSPDFRRHSVAFFIEPVLARHDRDAFEVFCYSNVATPDAITRQLLALADSARSISAMTDSDAAELVRSDEIDILVDLAGHTSRGRLTLFALKPAPVQVSYLGYPNTSGVGAIDWRLTDLHADPPGESDEFHSERLARLPGTFLCFRPSAEAPEVHSSPHIENGFVTFGSFNALSKITPEVIATWAGLLGRVRGSRLLLKAAGLCDTGACERLIGEFARHGIASERLALHPMDGEFKAHLDRYREIDIALDSFPYNGTTTTLEALWMGVPVISIAGDRHSARVGESILANLGLGALVAKSTEDYQAIAANLASDYPRLALLRGTMRRRIAESPLRDESAFMDALENAYRQMWRSWCQA